MEATRTADIVVIGGGAIGVAAAFELATAGAEVTLIERGPSLASGCSQGNTGLIRTSHAAPLATPAAVRQGLRWMLRRDSPFYVHPRLAVLPWLARFVAASRDSKVAVSTRLLRALSITGRTLHAEYARSGLDTGFHHNGILNLYLGEEAFADGLREAAGHAAAGERNHRLAPEEVRQLAPGVSPDIAGAIHYPDDANCEPLRFVETVGRAAAARGARLRLGTEVKGLERRRGRITAIRTAQGPIHPGTVVLAAGVWSARLARDIGVFVPLEAAKGYHVDLARAPGDPAIPVFLKEARVIATPLDAALRFGGTLEFAGLDPSIDRVRTSAIETAARRTFPHVAQSPVTELWSGLRPCSPDGLPIIGRVPGFENLVLATGHGMSGLQLAPVTGRFVAELILGRPPTHDLTPFRPERFRALLGRL